MLETTLITTRCHVFTVANLPDLHRPGRTVCTENIAAARERSPELACRPSMSFD